MRFITILFLIVPFLAKAQVETFDIPTPNAAELGRYGDVPVSYFTGKADISIPLYSLEVKGVTLPITLNYNSSGVLVNNLPGWLGDNWSLSAGGLITRVVQGYCDEYQRPELENEDYVEHNYFQSYNVLPQIYLSRNALRDSARNHSCDLAPDIFYFNFMGNTGRFFLGNDGEWKVYSEGNFEVIFDYRDADNFIYPFIENYPNPNISYKQPKTIKGFIIRDAHGTEYHFGGDTDHIEYTIPFFHQSINEYSKSWMANSWYLNKVVDRNGNQLFTFTYQRGKFVAQLYNSAYIHRYTYEYRKGFTHYQGFSNAQNNYGFPYDGVLNAPVYLMGIAASNGVNLAFFSDDWGKPMDEIYGSMYSRYGTLMDWYTALVEEFNHQNNTSGIPPYPFYYLQSNDGVVTNYQYNFWDTEKETNPLYSTRLRKLTRICQRTSRLSTSLTYTFDYEAGTRLCLKTVNIKDGELQTIGKYQLKYDYGMLASDYITTAEDHWGYYNAHPISEYPVDTQGSMNFLSYRKTNTSAIKKGLLTEIIYPTGGKTVFDYEPHDYSQCMNEQRDSMLYVSGYAGGVRIKSIVNYDDTGGTVLQSRVFDYHIPATNQSSGQLFAQPLYYWGEWWPFCENSNSVAKIQMFRSSSILPLSNKFGTHIGYSYVTETVAGEGQTVFHYRNLSEAFDSRFLVNFSGNTLTPYDMYTERDYKRGCLLSVDIYDSQGAHKKKTEYVYRYDNPEAKYVLTSSTQYRNFMSLGQSHRDLFWHYIGGVYELFYPKYDVRLELTTTYEDNGNLSERTEYYRSEGPVKFFRGSYSHFADVRLLFSTVRYRQDEKLVTRYSYGLGLADDATADSLFRTQFFLQPLAVEQLHQNHQISKVETKYGWFNGHILPRVKLSYTNNVADTLVTYLDYTSSGAVSKYKQRGKPVTLLSWYYNDNYLWSMKEGGHFPTIYDYDPNTFKLSKIIQPNGYYQTFSYDAIGRLSEIRDVNGKLLKKITYNYQNK